MWCSPMYVVFYNVCCVKQFALCPTIVLGFTICVVKYMLCFAIVLYNICGVVQCVLCPTICVVLYNYVVFYNMCCVIQYVLCCTCVVLYNMYCVINCVV